MEKVYELYIKTTPEELWQAITDPELRRIYNFGAAVNSDWKPGSAIEMGIAGTEHQDRKLLGGGEVREVDPPWRLAHTMTALWNEQVQAEGPSLVTWEIEQIADSCRLTVTHSQLREGANDELFGGWPMILSGLKTLLECGQSLTTPGSLLYGSPGAERARP